MNRDELQLQIEQTHKEAGNYLKTIDNIYYYFLSNKHDFTNDEEKFKKVEETLKAFKESRKRLKELMEAYNNLN